MVLSRPPWSVFLANFAQNPPWKAEKQLRDADSHSRIFLEQSDESNLQRCVDKKMENVFSFKLV